MSGHDPTELLGSTTDKGSGGVEAPAAPSAQAAPEMRRRPRGWMAATAIATVAALAAGAYGAVTYQAARGWDATASSWQERAVALEGQRDELAAERDALVTERDDLAEELAATQAELADTNDELADTESALADRENRLANVTAQREAARDLVAQQASDVEVIEAVGDDLSRCVDDLVGWLRDRPAGDVGDSGSDAYFERGFEIATLCDQAQGNFATYVRARQRP